MESKHKSVTLVVSSLAVSVAVANRSNFFLVGLSGFLATES